MLPWVLRPAVLAGAGGRLLEWAEAAALIGTAWVRLLRPSRTALAGAAIGGRLLGELAVRWTVPTCLTVSLKRASGGAVCGARKDGAAMQRCGGESSHIYGGAVAGHPHVAGQRWDADTYKRAVHHECVQARIHDPCEPKLDLGLARREHHDGHEGPRAGRRR